MTTTPPTPTATPGADPAAAPRPRRVIRLGNGSTIEVLLTPPETEGTVSVYRWHLSPTSRGPAPHFHTTFGETFIVEGGEIDFFDGHAWRTLRPGDLAHASAGEVHGLRKDNSGPATLLMVLVPGVPREDYFARIAGSGPSDLARLHEAHDNHFVDAAR